MYIACFFLGTGCFIYMKTSILNLVCYIFLKNSLQFSV